MHPNDGDRPPSRGVGTRSQSSRIESADQNQGLRHPNLIWSATLEPRRGCELSMCAHWRCACAPAWALPFGFPRLMRDTYKPTPC
jgi:hypothetical protein